ncbi:IcmG-like type IV secretion system protein [Xanthomonas hortorum pv. vitians]|uniref:IcmG-like type IV secretion system protein n=1 Tax=Xanthomonas hortorum TaxID=56454 RepID=UPI001F325C7D|nr:IcmG-like type IV secretion system protein [Xanthomonas hortorum]MCE4289761.1 IcmG-like type IV secretion system protein [Xanthomonas hortorum pv. vitians]
MNKNFNHDDALPAGEYSDDQSVFTTESQSNPAAETGGKANMAKYMLIGFVVLIVVFVGWFGYKLMNRGGAATDTLSIPVQEQAAVPMTGAPATAVNPYGVPGETASGQIADSAAADAPVSLTDDQRTPGGGESAPAQQNDHAAGVQAEQQIAQPQSAAQQPQVAVATSQSSATPQATPSSDQSAVAETELEALRARVMELEKRVATMTASGRAVATASRTQPARRNAAPARPKSRDSATRPAPSSVTAAAKPEPVPASGIQLKAVLEGRAWLQLKNGETVSVAPGDTIPGAGTVSAVDVERNEVRLNNGTSLR